MSESFKEVFPKRFRELRIQRGKTQDEVAKYLGMGRTSVANYESGKNFPFTETFIKLAEFLETSIDYLLGQTHDPEPNVVQGRTGISILNLEDLPLSYNGKELTPEQKRHVVTLAKVALEMQDKQD